MNQSDDLSVLREKAAVRHIHKLQQVGVVIQLHGNGVDVLRAGDHQVHRKCVALFHLNGWRVEKKIWRGRGAGALARRDRRPHRRLILRLVGGNYRWSSVLTRRSAGAGSSRYRPGSASQFDSGRGSDVDRALIDFVDIGRADNVRNNRENDLVLGMVLGGLAEQIPQDRNLRQARNSAELLSLLVFHDAAQKVGLTIFKADFVLNLALSNDRLADAADVLLASDRRDVHRNL